MLRTSLFASIVSALVTLCASLAPAQASSIQVRLDAKGLAHTKPFQATFELNYAGTDVGFTQWKLSVPKPNQYRIESESKATGLYSVLRPERISESSRGAIRAASPLPSVYRHVRVGGKRDRDIDATFDRSSGTIRHRYNQDRWSTPISTNTVDSLSYFLALASALARGEKRFTFKVVEAHKIKTYQLERRAERQIQTPAGTFRAVEVVRLNMRAKRKMSIWCAEELGFLPVLVEHTETEGYKVGLALKSFRHLR